MDFTVFKLPKDFDIKGFTPLEILVYARFVAIAKDEKFFIFTDSMAKEQLNVSKSSLNRVISKLVKEGLIEVQKFFNGTTNVRTIKVFLKPEFGAQKIKKNELANSQNENMQSTNLGSSQNCSTSQNCKVNFPKLNSLPYTPLKEVIDRKVIDLNMREKNEKRKKKFEIPKSENSVVTVFRNHVAKNLTKHPELKFLDVEEQAHLFWLYWNDEQNWKDNKGKPVKSLELRVATWIGNWRKSSTQGSVRLQIKKTSASESRSARDWRRLQKDIENGNIFGTTPEPVDAEFEEIGSSDIMQLGFEND